MEPHKTYEITSDTKDLYRYTGYSPDRPNNNYGGGKTYVCYNKDCRQKETNMEIELNQMKARVQWYDSDVKRLEQENEELKGQVYSGVGPSNNGMLTLKSCIQEDKRKLSQQMECLYKDLEENYAKRESQIDAMMQADRPASGSHTELQYRETDNHSLKTKVAELERANKRLREKLEEARDAAGGIRTQLKEEIKKLKQENINIRADKVEFEKSTKDLSDKLGQAIEKLKLENEDLSQRLSAEMSTKISKNESTIENVSIKNRPMNLAQEYNQICTGSWLAAKMAIDEALSVPRYNNYNEEQKLYYLCNVFMVAQEKAIYWQNIFRSELCKLLLQPLNDAVSRIRMPAEEYSYGSIPDQVKNAVGDYLRVSSKKTDLTRLITEVNKEVLSTYSRGLGYVISYKPNAKKAVSQFTEEAAMLAWDMINQRPEMTFHNDGIGQSFNPEFQEPNWGSPEPGPGVTVSVYASPVLCHSRNIMAKGKVLLRKKESGQHHRLMGATQEESWS